MNNASVLNEQFASTIKDLLGKLVLLRFQKNYVSAANSAYKCFIDTLGGQPVEPNKTRKLSKLRRAVNAIRFCKRLARQHQSQSLFKELMGTKASDNPRVTLLRYFSESLVCRKV
jgi:hypothetical protein